MKASSFLWLMISLIVILVACVLFIKKCNADKPDIIATTDSVQYWKNKNGELVASIKQREQDFNKTTEGLLDSIAKIYRTKPKFIKEYIRITTEGKEVLVPVDNVVEIYVDSSNCPQSLTQSFSSPYYLSEVTINRNSDSSKAVIFSVDTLTVLWKTVKEGNLFNRRSYLQLDISNANPNNHITSINTYRQPLPKPKKFGIGFHVGYGLGTDLKFRPVVSVGINYSIIRF